MLNQFSSSPNLGNWLVDLGENWRPKSTELIDLREPHVGHRWSLQMPNVAPENVGSKHVQTMTQQQV